jgi:hypothetical protein
LETCSGRTCTASQGGGNEGPFNASGSEEGRIASRSSPAKPGHSVEESGYLASEASRTTVTALLRVPGQ